MIKFKRKSSKHLTVFILVAQFWSLFIISLYIFGVRQEKFSLRLLVLSNIRTYVAHIHGMVAWSTYYGGIIVPKDKAIKLESSPGTESETITTTDGHHLTLLNPANMIQQIAKFTKTEIPLDFRLTSLEPINPNNAPEAWEVKGLKSFKNFRDEYWEWSHPQDQTRQEFHYISPLVVQESCLACHADQGVKTGGIYGGISITMPVQGILNEQKNHIHDVRIQSLLIWTIGMIGIVVAFISLRREYFEKVGLVNKLETALTEVKTLSGFIPICASCKKVRNDDGFWDQIEKYILERSDAQFSHSICPECREKLYPELGPSKVKNGPHHHDDTKQ